MKDFFKDYGELQKQSNAWMKKHWKGYLVFAFVVTVLSFLPYIIERVKLKLIMENFSKEEDM